LDKNVPVATGSIAVSNGTAQVSNGNNWGFNEIVLVSSENIAKLSVKFPGELQSFLQKAIQEHRTDELSDEPMTRSLLKELQDASD